MNIHQTTSALLTHRIRAFLLAVAMYTSFSVFFLFGLIKSMGDVAQADWSLPITD